MFWVSNDFWQKSMICIRVLIGNSGRKVIQVNANFQGLMWFRAHQILWPILFLKRICHVSFKVWKDVEQEQLQTYCRYRLLWRSLQWKRCRHGGHRCHPTYLVTCRLVFWPPFRHATILFPWKILFFASIFHFVLSQIEQILPVFRLQAEIR